MLIKNEDILRKLSKEQNLPYELLRILFNDFWHQMLMHLQHPENNFIKGIKIRDCIKFRLNPKQVMASYCRTIKSGFTETDIALTKILVHNQLKDNNVYTEKQKQIIQDCERLGVSESREEGNHSNEEE